MSEIFYTNIDVKKNEIQNVSEHKVATVPASPFAGQRILMTANDGGLLLNHAYIRDTTNSSWLDITADPTAVTRSVVAGASNELMVSGGANRTATTYVPGGANTLIKLSASGVVSDAVAGTDYLTASSTNTLTNKTIDANGTGNSISNLETADFAANVIDTDGTLTANSDTRLATQKATKTYIDTRISGLGKLVGGHDASGGLLPTTGSGSAGAIMKGDSWYITVAGTITGLQPITAVEVGDVLIAEINSASLAADFTVLQTNLSQATTTVGGTVILATAAEAEAKTDTQKAVVPADLANFARLKVVSTVTDGVSTTYAITHNLGKALTDLIVQLRDGTTGAEIHTTLSAVNTNSFNVNFDGTDTYPAGSFKTIITCL